MDTTYFFFSAIPANMTAAEREVEMEANWKESAEAQEYLRYCKACRDSAGPDCPKGPRLWELYEAAYHRVQRLNAYHKALSRSFETL